MSVLRRYGAALVGAAFLLIVFYYTYESYYRGLLETEGPEDASARECTYQFSLIVDDPTTAFWQAVYENGAVYAEDHDVLLVMKGPDEDSRYDKLDHMNMSIAARVDGIIVEDNGEAGLAEKIDEAVQNGIPVVTVMSDSSHSLRQSFVGVSDYQLGAAYGTQVSAYADETTRNILILVKREIDDNSQSQLYSQIYNAAFRNQSDHREAAAREGRRGSGSASGDVNVSVVNLLSSGPFDAEEAIRDILQQKEGPPDLLICMDEEATECARQAVIDFNMAGTVKIIGYYTSETILDAVTKGVVSATCSIDTDQLGQYSIEALLEYIREGRANTYYNVDITFVDEVKAKALQRRANNEKASME